MKLYFVHNLDEQYLHRSSCVRRLFGEILKERGHDVHFYPEDIDFSNVDFIIANEPAAFKWATNLSIYYNIPLIAFCHAIPQQHEAWEFPNFKNCFDHACRVICVAKHVADKLKNRKDLCTYASKIDWIHVGFDERIIPTELVEKEDYIVTFGDNAPHRHTWVADEAAKKLGIQCVHIDGQTDEEKYEIVKKAKCLVMPVTTGGTPMPPAECLYAGTPVVLSDWIGHRELYPESEDIRYFKIDDVNDCIRAIKEVQSVITIQYINEYLTSIPATERFENYLQFIKDEIDGKLYNKDYFLKKEHQFFMERRIGYAGNEYNYDADCWMIQLKLIKDLVPNLRNKRILDFGSGLGWFVDKLRELRYDCWGYDIISIKDIKNEVVPFILKELEGKFDVIWSSQTFEHIIAEKIPEVLQKLKSCLSEDGIMIHCIDINDDDESFHINTKNREWWEYNFEQCGFKKLHTDKQIQDFKEHNWHLFYYGV